MWYVRWLVLAFSLSTTQVHGQQSSDTASQAVVEHAGDALSLEEVLSSTRRHHPMLLAERAALDGARAEELAARGEFDTTLTVQGRAAPYGYYDPRRLDALVEQPTPLLGASLYAGYRLTRGRVAPYYGEQRTLDRGEVRGGVRLPLVQDLRIDARRAGVRSSRAQAEAQGHALEELLLDMEREAAQAYFTWQAAGQRLSVLERMVELATLRDQQIREKVALGALPSIEQVDNARSLLDRRRQLIGARRSYEKSALDLSLFVRDETGKPRVPVASELPPELGAVRELAPSVASAEASALARRPELAAVRSQVEVARVDTELADNRVRPRLDAFGEVSKDFGSAEPALAATLEPTVFEVGVTFSMPLWLRKARGKLRAAQAKLAASEQKARFAQDKVLQEVRDAWSQLEAARERAAIAGEAAELAEKVASGERERFELGATTVLFVNLREQSAADARVALIDALAELQSSAARATTVAGASLID